jgi:IS5 family transposase
MELSRRTWPITSLLPGGGEKMSLRRSHLAATLDQAKSISGVAAERIYVDRGYRGHDYTGAGEVMIAGRRRGLSATMHRELRRRSAIEATIGHMKTDGRLDRNFVLGQAGDAINALLAAAGHNLRLMLTALALWLACLLAAIAKAIAKTNTSAVSSQPNRQ